MKLKELVILLLLGMLGSNYLYAKNKYDKGYDKMSYKEAIRKVATPIEAKNYCLNHLRSSHNSLDYKSYYYNFKDIHEKEKVSCVNAAVSCIALLSDDGYPPYLLSFGENNTTGHTVFLYKKENKYGSIGINQQDFTKPIFSSEKTLASYLFLKIYNRFPKGSLYWEVKDLSKLGNFIDGKVGKGFKVKLFRGKGKELIIDEKEIEKYFISGKKGEFIGIPRNSIIRKGEIYLRRIKNKEIK